MTKRSLALARSRRLSDDSPKGSASGSISTVGGVSATTSTTAWVTAAAVAPSVARTLSSKTYSPRGSAPAGTAQRHALAVGGTRPAHGVAAVALVPSCSPPREHDHSNASEPQLVSSDVHGSSVPSAPGFGIGVRVSVRVRVRDRVS